MLKTYSRTAIFTLCIMLLFAALVPAYAQSYVIQPGDSLWKISRHFGVSIDSLKQANDLSGNLIIAGETLEVPQVHIVQAGDTLFLLARRYSTTIDAIMRQNNLSGSMILVGQRLIIPATGNSGNQGPRLNVNSDERTLMARAVHSEARGEPYTGKVAVAAVIINRVLHPEYPNTVSGVIYEPWAFTAVHDGQFWLTPDQTAYNAVETALQGSDPSHGSIFYYNPITATNQWIRSRPIVTQIGRHVFAR